jgi:general secretion pathway protein A
MYQRYFGLAEAPFSIAPAPRFLYMSQRHQEALAHLLYGVNGGGGFVLLTGEVGAGKTTVCRCLLEQIPDTCDVAYIFNPRLTVEELLASICVEFGIACPPGNTSIKVFVDCINAHLLDAHARGRQAVLIIDEAQNLSAEVLEQMRLLTNLETSERKLLQIILIGQPELAAMLERPELKQLAQRIVARYHLGPLSRTEVAAYIRHRLDVAGSQRPLFPPGLMRRLHRLSGGVPRIINVLCDRALLGTYVQGKERVDRKTLNQAEREVLPAPSSRRRKQWLIAALLGLAATGASLALLQQPDEKMAPAARKQAKPVPLPAATSSAAVPHIAEPARFDWATAANTGSETQAIAALFSAWGADYRGGEPCQEAARLGLRCREERDNLDGLRRLDRPAVLTLRDDQGREVHAALLQLDTQHARLSVGGTRVNVTSESLNSHWTGNYRMFWRTPEQVEDTLRPGDSNPGVAWLRAQLARIEGSAPEAVENTLFDADLAQRVKRFQQAHNLKPDANVGPNTLILLTGEADASAPRLGVAASVTPPRNSGAH